MYYYMVALADWFEDYSKTILSQSIFQLKTLSSVHGIHVVRHAPLDTLFYLSLLHWLDTLQSIKRPIVAAEESQSKILQSIKKQF